MLVLLIPSLTLPGLICTISSPFQPSLSSHCSWAILEHYQCSNLVLSKGGNPQFPSCEHAPQSALKISRGWASPCGVTTGIFFSILWHPDQRPYDLGFCSKLLLDWKPGRRSFSWWEWHRMPYLSNKYSWFPRNTEGIRQQEIPNTSYSSSNLAYWLNRLRYWMALTMICQGQQLFLPWKHLNIEHLS